MQTNTNVENHTRARETFSVCGWDWLDEDRLAAFAEQETLVIPSDRAEMVHRMEATGQPGENHVAYAALYFIA